MHKYKWIILQFLLVLQSTLAIAQEDSLALSDEYFLMGMEVYDFDHRRQAKDLFELSAIYNPKNADAHLMAGRTILLTVHKEEALSHFIQAWILKPDVDEDILFLIGQAYHHSEQFDSAILFYEQFNRQLARSMRFRRSIKINEVNRKIFECRNGKIFKFYPVDVTIENLSDDINSEWPEYAPTITADESMMVFTSRRPDGNVNPTVAEDLDFYEDIYVSIKQNGKWQYAKNIGPPLNTLYHNASINLSPDGSEIFIYSDENGGDIYESLMQPDGTWGIPTRLKGEVNSQYLENSATITSDGTKLYFTSNRPGGYGGTDLYVSEKNKNGAWVKPLNLGPNINTEFDEDGAFISASGEHLYFSSLGHAGMGDMDIYRAEYNHETESWEPPINLGYPINSVENDIYFVLTGDEKFAYYSSVKTASKGEQDIYKIDMTNWAPVDLSHPVFIEAWLDEDEEKAEAQLKIPSIIDLHIEVVDEITLKPMMANVVMISEDDRVLSPTSTGQGKYGFEFTNESYSKYEVRITQEGYLPHISDIYVLGTESKRHEINQTILLKKARKNFTGIVKVYFAHNSDTPHSFEDIQYIEMLLTQTPSLKVEIAGHTDDVGPAEYNQNLSQRRAESVRVRLIESGIDANRIVAVGYGEEKPVSDNSTRRGRRLNRRTEFTILEE